MRRRLWAGCLLSTLLGWVLAAAQSPAPSAAPAPPAAKPLRSKLQDRTLNLFKLDLQMTRSLTDSQANRDRLLVVYEKLVELQCMGSLPWELAYSGPPEDPECRGYLEELRALHPDNPVLVCAEKGIDAEACQQAYQEQFISTQTSADGTVAVVDLEAKLSALENEEKTESLYQQLTAAANAYASSGRPEDKQHALQLLEKIIPRACKYTRIIIEHSQPSAKKMAELTAAAAPSGDPLRTLISEYGGLSSRPAAKATPRPTPTPSPPHRDPFETARAPDRARPQHNAPLWRVRYLTFECMEAVKRARALDDAFPPAVCYQQGFTAPDCITAKRRQREAQRREAEAAARRQAGSASGKQSGLEPF